MDHVLQGDTSCDCSCSIAVGLEGSQGWQDRLEMSSQYFHALPPASVSEPEMFSVSFGANKKTRVNQLLPC